MARPTKYNPDILEKTELYIENYFDEDDMIPSISGLSCVLGLHRDTIHAWKKDPDKKAFSDMLDKLSAVQHRVLINKGLSGEFNSNIAKLALTKHGYSDKTENKVEVVDGTDEELANQIKQLQGELNGPSS